MMRSAIIFLFAALLLACSDAGNGPASKPGVETRNGKVTITDRTGKKWDVTHAQEKYGMMASEFQFGLGPFAIRPILNGKMLSEGDPGYPIDEASFLVMGTSLNGETRAYPISVMSWHEIADEVFGDAHVAVAY